MLIYGSGAVGLGLASCLLKAGVEVDLIDKEEEIVASLCEHGLQGQVFLAILEQVHRDFIVTLHSELYLTKNTITFWFVQSHLILM